MILKERRLEKLRNVNLIISELKEQLSEEGIKGAVIGISGGKDSTIVAKLMVEALGKENVLGVLMPNGVQKDINDALRVIDILDIPSTTINIGDSFNALYEETNKALKNITEGITEDSRVNIAPRLRMAALYAIAQSMGNGWRVIGTTNKSEDYVGWLTKWGDGGCDFEPIIDLTVTELRVLGEYLGLPKDLIYKIPIDGLSEGSDEDKFGFSYEQLDDYIFEGTSGKKDVDKKIEKMHLISNHKRKLISRYILLT